MTNLAVATIMATTCIKRSKRKRNRRNNMRCLRETVLNHSAKCLLLSREWTWKKRATMMIQTIKAPKVSKVDYLLNNKTQNNILFNKKTTLWMIMKKIIFSPNKIRLEVLVLSLLQIKLIEN